MTKTIRWGVTSLASLGVLGLASFVGCSSDTSGTNPTDAGSDTIVIAETGTDAGPTDTGHDSGAAETATDAKAETATDTGASETATDTGGSETATDAGGSETATDAGSDTDAGPPTGSLRFANLVSDSAATGFDFCIVPAATVAAADFTTTEPAIFHASGGLLPGLTYGKVLGYNGSFVAGTSYAIRIVAGGVTSTTAATACATELVTGSTALIPTVTANSFGTVVVYGLKGGTGATALAVTTLSDLSALPAGATGTSVRVFHGIPGGPVVDVAGLYSGTWLDVADGYSYGTAVPANGINAGVTSFGIALDTAQPTYIDGIPTALATAQLGVWVHGMVGADGGSPLLTATVDFSNARLLTLYAAPTMTGTQTIQCDDTTTPVATATSPYSTCTVLSP